ncbi:WD40 repeat domain-containing protein [Deinococcus murrayi]|uniref:WD40 repeat domain-containing protein n=1 Tax=Deinococcus murrayi TaxID=68910 RepID=UPI00047FB141|nr:WD40 repeat domain-containing protein [Deinococcus murrayi]
MKPLLLALLVAALPSQAAAQLRTDIRKDTPPGQATMRVYDGGKLLFQATTQGLNAVTESKFSADGRWLLNIADGQGYVQLWDVENGERVRTFLGTSFRVNGADFTPDSQRLLLDFSGDRAQPDTKRPAYFPSPSLWDLATLERIAFLYNDKRESFYDGAVQFSADGRRMVFVRTTDYSSGPASIWDAYSGRYITTVPRLPYPAGTRSRWGGASGSGAGARAARLSPDGGRVLVLYVDGRLAEYDADTASLLRLRGKPAEAQARAQLDTFARTGK